MGSPPQRSQNTATVTVTVDRNKNTPTFKLPSQYKVEINEKFTAGTELFRLDVEDRDKQVGCLTSLSVLQLSSNVVDNYDRSVFFLLSARHWMGPFAGCLKSNENL